MCRLFRRLFGRRRAPSIAVEPEPVEPEPVEPEPVEPEPVEPEPVEPEPVEPEPVEPEPPRDWPVPHDPPPVEIPTHPEPEALPGAYSNGRDYLGDEFARLDCLVKAYLIRRRSKSSSSDPVQDVTAARFDWVDAIDDVEIRRETDRQIAKARKLESTIARRLRLTQSRAGFPVWELARFFQLAPAMPDELPADGAPRATPYLDLVLLALLIDRFPRYLPALTADGSPGLTAGAALEILQPDARPDLLRWDAFAPDRPPVQQGLIELDPADSPGRRTVRIDPRTADYLLETPNPTVPLPGVRAVVAPRDWNELLLDAGPRDLLAALSARWWDRTRRPLRLTLLLYGPAGSPFLETVEAFLTRTVDGDRRAMPFLLVDGAAAARVVDWDGFVRRLYRESAYRRCPVVWTDAGSLLAPDQPPARWEALVRAAEATALPTFLTGDTPWDPTGTFRAPGQHFVRVELPLPAPPTRRAIWIDRLARERHPIAADDTPTRATALDLIETFQFSHGQIDDAIATARGLALLADPTEPAATAAHLYEACRRQSARRLVTFATRIPPRPDAADAGVDPKLLLARKVVLPPAAAAQLEELHERMRSYARVYHDLGFEQRLHLGRGLVALFSGPTGTGKTLAATALAALNGKDLYRVDMAAVVSKYVGETEKNLGRVFADAQDANAVLFFDEADALFGKRGTVEQGQDRWANLEVNYLLQRVEEYTGTVILATNIRENIDEAFLRRIQVLLEFPRPDEAARLNILERMFPPRVMRPDGAVLREFARRFDVTGGNIKNAVLDAAFRAVADAGGSEHSVTITDEHLALGFAREYQKIGLPISPGVFGRKYYGLALEKLRLDGPRAADAPRRGTG